MRLARLTSRRPVSATTTNSVFAGAADALGDGEDALGLGDQVVAVTHECDYPESIRGRPVLTRARIDARASSRAIDAAVRAVVRDALSIYVVDDQQLAALQAQKEQLEQEIREMEAVQALEERRQQLERESRARSEQTPA